LLLIYIQSKQMTVFP